MPKTQQKKPTEKEDPKQLERAITLFTKVVLYRRILRNHNSIANSPIPKKKQQKHTQLVATWIMNTRNAESSLDEIYNKLTSGQQIAFLLRSKQLL